MDAIARGHQSRPGRIERTIVWLRDQIVAKVIVGVAVAAALVFLGLSATTETDRIQVANVYNLPRDRGLDYIADQGFTNVRVIGVCSNSVAAGRIREVLLDDGASVADETVFVGPQGSKPVQVLVSTKLLVKVSNGKACP
jgi:hypothetical protein